MCPGGRWLGCGPAPPPEEAKRLWVKGEHLNKGAHQDMGKHLDKGHARTQGGTPGQEGAHWTRGNTWTRRHTRTQAHWPEEPGGGLRSASGGVGGGVRGGPRAWQSASSSCSAGLWAGVTEPRGRQVHPLFPCSAPHTLGGRRSRPASQPICLAEAPGIPPTARGGAWSSRQELLASDKWRVTCGCQHRT